MADNVTLPSTAIIATDEVGGAQHQLVKIEFGANGTATPVSASDPLPVTAVGTVAVSNLPATQPVSGPLTNAELRAAPVDVAGSLTIASTQDQPLTDTQLRAVAVPISADSLPLPTGATQEGTAITGQALEAGGGNVLGWLSSLRKAMTDRLPAALAANGGLKIEGVAGGVAVPVSGTFWQATQPVSLAAAVAVTDNGGSLTIDSTQLPTALVNSRLDVNLGAATTSSTLPVSIAQLPAALVSSRLDVNVGAVTTSSTMPVSIASLPALAAGTNVIGGVQGDIAHDSTDAGNVLKTGTRAIVGAAAGGLPTAVAGNDRVQFHADVYGRQSGRKTDSWYKSNVPAAGAQATCNSTAQAAGVRNVCTSITCSLTSTAAATAVNPVQFSLHDGTTAGTVLWAVKATMPLTAGAAWSISLTDLWIEGTAATAMTLATAAATTTNVAATVAMTGTISQ